VFLFLVLSVLVVLLWIFAIMMFRVLSKCETSEDPISKTLYFAKLKFTRLTLLSSIVFLFSMIFLIVWVLGVAVFPGFLGWYLYVIAPVFWNLSPSLMAAVLFLGMTNWKAFKSIYCCRKD
jgi:hypothetical protein